MSYFMRRWRAERLGSIILQHVTLAYRYRICTPFATDALLCYFSTPSFHKLLPTCMSVYALQMCCKNVPTN